jgi:hypothetical protein
VSYSGTKGKKLKKCLSGVFNFKLEKIGIDEKDGEKSGVRKWRQLPRPLYTVMGLRLCSAIFKKLGNICE